MKIKVLVADDDAEFTKRVCEVFALDDSVSVVGVCNSGSEVAREIAATRPDVLLLDLVMPGEDGYSILERLDKGDMRVIAVSALSREAFISKAISLGADYFMTKPVTPSIMLDRIRDAVRPRPRPIRNKSLDEKLGNIFITVGIPAHIKGYQYLREAVKMTVENPDIINAITKRLYPEVAEHFNTSPSKVERAIRHAIEVAWSRGKIENINQVFGVRVYSNNEKPTNGEFIALVADKMLMEQA